MSQNKKRILYICPRIHDNFIIHQRILRKLSTLDVYQSMYGRISDDSEFRQKAFTYNTVYAIPSITKLWRLINRKKYDIILIKDLLTLTSLVAFSIAKLKNIDCIVFVQKIKPIKNKLINFLIKPIAKFVTKNEKAVSVTKIGLKQLAPYKFRHVSYIPFGVEKRKKTKQFRNKSTLTVITVTKAQKRKHVELLIDSLDNIAREHNFNINLKICLRVLDRNYFRSLQEKSEKAAINVEFKENIPHSEMAKEYLSSDLYILSSYDEPAAFSPLEAMSYGLPAICSSENGTANYITEGKTGSVFEAKKQKSLKKSILKIIGKKKKIDWNNMRAYSKRCLEEVQRNHREKKLEPLFEKLLHMPK